MSIDCQAGCGDSERRMKYNAIIQTYARVLTASVGLLSRKMLKLRQKWERTPESVEIRQFSQHLGLRNLLGIFQSSPCFLLLVFRIIALGERTAVSLTRSLGARLGPEARSKLKFLVKST
jgi:hypothetical protein